MAAKKQKAKIEPALKSAPAPKPSSGMKKVNWVLVLVMSIIFGYFGVDRFIMGKVGTGILKLAITLVTLGFGGFVWWVIDIVLIAIKSSSLNVEFIEN
jgi:TM2 domain-containing membrane protein YozV